MRNAVYIPPTRGQMDAIESSSMVLNEIEDVVERGKAHAEAAAPVDTGAYRSSFYVERVGDEVRLVNDDPGAAAIEYGTRDTPAHRTITQTSDWIEGGA
jgi:hypothetical protein